MCVAHVYKCSQPRFFLPKWQTQNVKMVSQVETPQVGRIKCGVRHSPFCRILLLLDMQIIHFNILFVQRCTIHDLWCVFFYLKKKKKKLTSYLSKKSRLDPNVRSRTMTRGEFCSCFIKCLNKLYNKAVTFGGHTVKVKINIVWSWFISVSQALMQTIRARTQYILMHFCKR